MASLREIRRKIQSVKSTQQITKAMKMVAAARMRRAQSSILSSRPFAVKMAEAVRDLAQREQEALGEGDIERVHPFFKGRPDEHPCLVLVTADRGLCGAFNAGLLRVAAQWLRKRQGQPLTVAAVGRKSRDFVRRLKDLECVCELVGIFPKASFVHAEILGEPLIKGFSEGKFSSVTVMYNEFKSIVVQKVVERRLLPVPLPESAGETGHDPFDFKFEPGRDKLLDLLLERHLKAQLYRILLESQAAELAARMNAMEAATKNAGELINNLTLDLNRTRQAIITREIAEIVGGAEALAS